MLAIFQILSNMQVYKLLTYLMDWMYASEESRSGDKPLCTDKLPVNCVQEKCAKVSLLQHFMVLF